MQERGGTSEGEGTGYGARKTQGWARTLRTWSIGFLSLATLVGVVGIGAAMVFVPEAVRVLGIGSVRELREPAARDDRAHADAPALLILAMDGMNRKLLYEELEAGNLPGLARLLGGEEGEFPHAHFEPDLISVLPTASIAAWSSLLTGQPPADHGAVGNEFFVREERRKAAPVGVSFVDPMLMLRNLTEGYANRQLQVPTIYERMREREPSIRIWVGLHQVYAGADRLLLARPRVLGQALTTIIENAVTPPFGFERSYLWFGDLDREVIRNARVEIEAEGAPDVLTIYTFGTDSIAHRSPDGHDEVRRRYLRDTLDAEFSALHETLVEAGTWHRTYVTLVSDHGLTEVVRDRERALLTDPNIDPPAVLLRSGFRVRPFRLEVPPEHDFQSVITYQGTLANVYLADRSACPREGEPCDFRRPPRFSEDVLAAAEAFYQASETGALVPRMRGTLDLVLTRIPRPWNRSQNPFSVYVGGGKLVPVADFLQENQRPEYVYLERRLRDLAVGPYGSRAGDILLIPNSGNRANPADRYYFADLFYAWHGSPSRQDAEIPLIVAHPRCSARELSRLVHGELGDAPLLYDVGRLLLRLRQGPVCGN